MVKTEDIVDCKKIINILYKNYILIKSTGGGNKDISLTTEILPGDSYQCICLHKLCSLDKCDRLARYYVYSPND
jgi:hypothetical protein